MTLFWAALAAFLTPAIILLRVISVASRSNAPFWAEHEDGTE